MRIHENDPSEGFENLTWDDVCGVKNCTHDSPTCGAWQELTYGES